MQDNLQKTLSEFAGAGILFELEEEITINKKEARGQKEEGPPTGGCAADSPARGEFPLIIPKAEPVGGAAVLSEARAAAAAAGDMGALLAAIKAFDRRTPTAKLAKNIVPPKTAEKEEGGRKKEEGRILVITDGPGKDDDEAGVIMSGEGGAMFAKMVAAIGLNAAEISVFPVVFHKLPGDRTPTNDEMAVGKVFFERFAELAPPEFILTLGQSAFSFAVPGGGTLVRGRGKVFEAYGAKVVPTFGLKLLMAKPEHKKDAWADLQKFKEVIGQKI
ncbi:MAG: uracil-DNA glycosylase [Rickettsiales bacterium]|jgi:DNA polymerase|nr:uracil-DNA glycosylase [Rickettsiales bacterium]